MGKKNRVTREEFDNLVSRLAGERMSRGRLRDRVRALEEKVEALESPDVELKAGGPSGEGIRLMMQERSKASRIEELEAEVDSLKEKMRTNANLLAAWRGEAVDQVAGNLARLGSLAVEEEE